MKNSELDLETTLRGAPQPKAPCQLEQRLLAGIPRANASRFRRTEIGAWFRRWWPALGPAAVSLVCAAVITTQQIEIHDLKQNLQTSATKNPVVDNAPPGALEPGANSAEPSSADAEQAEIQRLKDLAAILS